MQLHALPKSKTRKPARRVGRGPGSTKGKTSGRGHKGFKARSGSNISVGFEGGQMALIARTPKARGFNVLHDRSYQPFNLDRVEKMAENGSFTYAGLIASKFVKPRTRIKILGNGEIKSAITVEAHAFSASAVVKIEKAGGKATLIVKEVKPTDKKPKKKAVKK
ncbi:MAG: 50S ribosomal protein L15 [Patescibacteria group bacterium]